MKNHWLNRKKSKAILFHSGYGHHFELVDDWDCEMEDEKITSKKSNDTIKWNTGFDFTQSIGENSNG